MPVDEHKKMAHHFNQSKEIELVEEVNTCMEELDGASNNIGNALDLGICSYKWKEGTLHFQVEWFSEEIIWETCWDLQEDYQVMIAKYMVAQWGNKKVWERPQHGLGKQSFAGNQENHPTPRVELQVLHWQEIG